MADPARALDRIDSAPRFDAADVARLNARFETSDAEALLAAVIDEGLARRIAVVSSFGTESAVLLYLVSRVAPSLPVLFLDTGKMFPETLAYRDTLIERFGLTGVRTITPDPALIFSRDSNGLRWSYDPDGCCDLRKVVPLETALTDFDSTITGRKGFQSATRSGLAHFELDILGPGDRLKVNPLAGWDKARLDHWFETHDLPRHPLEAQGYLSIGCAPCTSIVKPGEDPRAGRWRGWDKVECGIHGEPIPRPIEDPGSEPVF